jgi:hypothetical protein
LGKGVPDMVTVELLEGAWHGSSSAV